jgi:hypothetical protein
MEAASWTIEDAVRLSASFDCTVTPGSGFASASDAVAAFAATAPL